jgi:hypothetical protein
LFSWCNIYKTYLTPPFVIEVKTGQWASCICVILILPLSTFYFYIILELFRQCFISFLFVLHVILIHWRFYFCSNDSTNRLYNITVVVTLLFKTLKRLNHEWIWYTYIVCLLIPCQIMMGGRIIVVNAKLIFIEMMMRSAPTRLVGFSLVLAAVRNVSPPRHIILIPSQPVFSLTP